MSENKIRNKVRILRSRVGKGNVCLEAMDAVSVLKRILVG